MHLADLSSSIPELRHTSGLTSEQSGRLFDVSWRSVHFWGQRKPMNAASEQRLLQILNGVRHADRGDARSNRATPFKISVGITLFELLARQRFAEARARLRDPGRRRVPLGMLDAKASAKWASLSPEALIDAINDRGHHDVRRDQAARVKRPSRTRVTMEPQ